MADADPIIPVVALRAFAEQALSIAGLSGEKAAAVAEVLVHTDALGHVTHGLALLPRYLEEIDSGRMARDGVPAVVSDRGAVLVLDGLQLPGCWLMGGAMSEAVERAERVGTATVCLGNSHHIGGLIAHLMPAVTRGVVVVIFSSSPGVATVAPFGGASPVLSPAPIAAGLPTKGDPILIDVSASISTNNAAAALRRQGRRYPTSCLIRPDGALSDDPAVLEVGGAHLPAGGANHGQKGYGWGLLSEVISQGLSGHGRADGATGMGNSAVIQAWDPAAFAGTDYFRQAAEEIARLCRRAVPVESGRRPRLPGAAALARARQAEAEGLPLSADLQDAVRRAAEASGIPLPEGLEGTEAPKDGL